MGSKLVELILRIAFFLFMSLVAMAVMCMGVICILLPDTIFLDEVKQPELVGSLLMALACGWIILYSAYHNLKFPKSKLNITDHDVKAY